MVVQVREEMVAGRCMDHEPFDNAAKRGVRQMGEPLANRKNPGVAKSGKPLVIVPEWLESKALLLKGGSQGNAELAAITVRRQVINDRALVTLIIDDLTQGRERYNLPTLLQL